MGIFTEDYSNETIVLGAGCFWCTEAVFKMLKGIISVDPGYAGGNTENPAYEDVATGKTGYAEVVKIVYNPEIISFNNLLRVFFATHDSTTINKQGTDVGEQYRSIILYTTKKQEKEAKKFITRLNRSIFSKRETVTHVGLLGIFYEAEQHLRDYYESHHEAPHCQAVINHKLGKLKAKFAKLIKKELK